MQQMGKSTEKVTQNENERQRNNANDVRSPFSAKTTQKPHDTTSTGDC